MLRPVNQKLLKSIDELFESDNYKIQYFEDFNFVQEDNPKFLKAFEEERVISFEILSEDDEEWTSIYIENKFASMQSCKHFKNLIEHQGDGKSWRGLYQIQEVALTERQNLFTAPFHPLLDKFQKLMDLSFEAGLPIAWERFHYEFLNSYNRSENFQRNVEDDQMLDFFEIAPFFLILIFGFLIALLALLCEVFYHDFLLKLPKNYLRMKYQNYVLRVQRKNVKRKFMTRVKVKRIQVKQAKEVN